MTGGTSGTAALTTGAWTVSGNWDTSGAGSTLTAGSSTVTLTGASSTLALAAGQRFYNLVIGGTNTITSPGAAPHKPTGNKRAGLTKTGQKKALNSLTENRNGGRAGGAGSGGDISIFNNDGRKHTP